MSAKIFIFDQVKKLMGWCPNAKANEARQNVSFENFNSDIPDRAGGENGDLKNPSWFRKMSNYILLINTLFTLVYILVINYLGINLIFLLAGLFISFFFVIFSWKTQMQRYDTLVKQPVIDYSDKEILYSTLAYVFLLVIFIIIFKVRVAQQALFSFVGGLVIGMWLSYFQLIYWQKKTTERFISTKNTVPGKDRISSGRENKCLLKLLPLIRSKS